MIVVYVAVKTNEDSSSEFEQIIREIQGDVRQMDGCVKNEWYRDPDSPCSYMIYGEFDTREHFESYLASAVVTRIGDELMPLLEVPPDFRHYDATLMDGS